MAMSQYLENALLNATVGNVSYTTPANVYMALYSVAPTGNTSGTELTGNGYSRQLVAFGSAANGVSTNTGTITFGPATSNDWLPVTATAILNASSSGNILYYTTVTSQNILVGSSLVLGTGNISVTLS